MNKLHCIIAVSPNSWGRGQTINEAIRNLVKSGGKKKGCFLRFVVGDDKAYLNDFGDLMIAQGATSYKLSEN